MHMSTRSELKRQETGILHSSSRIDDSQPTCSGRKKIFSSFFKQHELPSRKTDPCSL
ncbi:unnamed protein product [Periconia digitata]|uniref:Uncharacterized protein n=1 Tax=Periconia digitata TaxID=1303443 RepID=A0A9W4XPM7_9PLEO|nr:unnamed protein product [Periconia digitata]